MLALLISLSGLMCVFTHTFVPQTGIIDVKRCRPNKTKAVFTAMFLMADGLNKKDQN